MFKVIFHKEKGGSDDALISDMVKIRDSAKTFLSKNPSGSVEVRQAFGDSSVTIFYLDAITKAFKDLRTQAHDEFVIAHNEFYPYTNASTVVKARIKACALMHKEGWRAVGIFAVKSRDGSSELVPFGYIYTNGYRYEYNDYIKKKRYTLNPDTGRLSKY